MVPPPPGVWVLVMQLRGGWVEVGLSEYPPEGFPIFGTRQRKKSNFGPKIDHLKCVPSHPPPPRGWVGCILPGSSKQHLSHLYSLHCFVYLCIIPIQDSKPLFSALAKAYLVHPRVFAQVQYCGWAQKRHPFALPFHLFVRMSSHGKLVQNVNGISDRIPHLDDLSRYRKRTRALESEVDRICGQQPLNIWNKVRMTCR